MADEIQREDEFDEDIQFIRTTDRVLGDPPGTRGTLTGPINVALQKIANALTYLKNRIEGLTVTVPNATTTTRGIAEIATKAEAEGLADGTRITPPVRVHDIVKSDNAQATTTQRGTVKRADQNLGEAAVDDETYMTPRQVRHARRHANANASEQWRGTAKVATTAQAEAATDDTTMMTPAKTEDYFDHRVVKMTQAAFNALNPKPADQITLIVG